MKTKLNLLQAGLVCGVALGIGSSFSQAAAAAEPANPAPAKASIPWSQIGAKAGADYQGEGLAVSPAAEGARLRCVFQRLEGAATREGLWLTSTVTNGVNDRFRVTAARVGRVPNVAQPSRLRVSGASSPVFVLGDGTSPELAGEDARATSEGALPCGGTVAIEGQTVRFIRPGLVEEYSVSMDGVRQDFVVLERPTGAGELAVRLAVSGAKVEPAAGGAQLVLDKSGRKIAYSRLGVTDATGKELAARLVVEDAAALAGANVGSPLSPALSLGEREKGLPLLTKLSVAVDDADAVYPVRIDPTFSDANWISMGTVPGANSSVNAAVVDGAGNLYIGGAFTAVGDVVANYVAKWDGSSWSALGSGMNSYVNALAVSGSDLYVGGGFTTAGGSAANYVAKWNGSSWSALASGLNYYVSALAVSGSDLCVGGAFTTAGGSAATNVAKWNGSSWSALGSGMGGGSYSYVNALAVSGSDLYAGGYFTTAGSSAATNVAKWNGSNWSALGSGMGGVSYPSVNALAVSGSDLYVGGYFTTAGGSAAYSVAKWNGSSWSALGSGMGGPGGYNPYVYALAVSGSDLYVGGYFVRAGNSVAYYVAKWNGSSWSTLGSGMNYSVTALAVSGSGLYAGGGFMTAGGSAANNVAKWNGSSWAALGSGMNSGISALAVSGSDVYVGGSFATAGGSGANYIAKWHGSSWSALGSGVSGVVYSLAVSGSDLYVGGYFTTAGSSTANNVAKWNGSSWSALGSGLNSAVNALVVSGSDLYAGGDFTAVISLGIVANRVARWNGSSWSALGSGMGGVDPSVSVKALAVSGSDLYVGGLFTTAGGSAATNVAKWNGSSWSALGAGMGGGGGFFPYVYALGVSGSDLYVGGAFTMAGGSAANYVAKWNGSSWSALGSGMGGGTFPCVYALAVSGSDLYVGGPFTTAGGSAANYVAKWNGSSWSALGSGMNSYVNALAVSSSDLYVGGLFTIAGGKVSAHVARANLLGNLSAAGGRFSNLAYSQSIGFSCIFSDGMAGEPYRIQASPSLAVGSWSDLTNFTYTGPIAITDSSAPGPTNRYYRAVWGP
jgi:hypothetical protein